jgi:AcrR family transcriptional regulator
MSAFAMRSLPPGRHGLSREYVARHQRERLLAAIADCLDRVGYEKTTVSLIAGRAGVSKSHFYRYFDSKDECFVYAYDDAAERLRVHALAACVGRREWPDRVCAALDAGLCFLSREPARANLLLVEGVRAGVDVYDRFQAAIQTFVVPLREGAPLRPDGDESPEGLAEAVVGGIASLLGRRVQEGKAERLDQFFPEVAEFTLTPFLGAAEARRIVSTR